jgi:hypothetical protein
MQKSRFTLSLVKGTSVHQTGAAEWKARIEGSLGGVPILQKAEGTAANHTCPNWWWEPPHLCGGKSPKASSALT